MTIHFEKAIADDVQKLIEVQNKAFYEDYIKYGECPGYGRSMESMLGSIQEADTFKIIVDDDVVGNIIVRKKAEGEYHLGGLCVIPEYENQGIGQEAMAFIDDYYKDARYWSLETPADKKRNHYFYKKCGFKIVETSMDGNVQIVHFARNKGGYKMKLQTKRMELVPLTLTELRLLVNDMAALEKKLNCYYKAEPIVGFFLKIIKSQIKILESDPNHYVWHSFWLLIRKNDRVVVGSADFKAPPNENGETEIGYGLGKEFEHNGYMTEAVKSMCNWGLKQEGVKSIIAETYLDNLASQRILTKCGFVEEKRDETIWFRLVENRS